MNGFIGIVGYGATGLGYLFLFLLLLTTRQHSLPKKILMISSIISLIWALSAMVVIHFQYPIEVHLSLETLRNIGWFLLLACALSDCKKVREIIFSSFSTKAISVLLLIVMSSELLSAFFSGYWLLNTINQYMPLIHLAQSVLGLWLIENLYRQTERSARWTVKPLCLGLGLFYAYDFAYYADSLLTQSFSATFWYARSWVVLMTIPLIVLTARRVKNWSARVYVSRDVIYHSTLLLVAGGYLLFMALVGYYIKYVNGHWGQLLQNVFFSMSGLILASLFLSEPLRRKMKVFITKHFFANKYEYREEWMRFASILNEPQASPYIAALNAVMHPFACSSGVIALKEGNTFVTKAQVNTPEHDDLTQELLDQLSNLAIQYHWIIDINELKNESKWQPFAFNANLIPDNMAFSYIIPLTNAEGFNAVCLLSHPTSTESINWEDRDLMRAISAQITTYLHLYHTNIALAESKQFDTFNQMSAFLVHDLKNVVAQLHLLSKNAQKHKHNPEFIDDAFETVDSAVNRLTKVLDQLRNKRTANIQTEMVDLHQALTTACKTRSGDLPKPQLHLSDSFEPRVTVNKERLTNMLSHLIQNAQDATHNDGSIVVSTAQENQHCIVTISDTGSGMSEEFINERLFKPFDTTKGNAGMGIGAYDAKKLVEETKGYIQVSSEIDKGTHFKLHFPITENHKHTIAQ